MTGKEGPLKTEIKKIKAKIGVSGAPKLETASFEFRDVEFIYGVGVEGLTPFEVMIANLSKGDDIQFSVKPENVPETFGRLAGRLEPLNFISLSDIHFRVLIADILSVSDRDIVKAMAAGAACGEGCCGAH